MTVKELIDKLRALPGDLELYVRDTDDCREQPLVYADFVVMEHIVTTEDEDDIVEEEGTNIVVLEY